MKRIYEIDGNHIDLTKVIAISKEINLNHLNGSKFVVFLQGGSSLAFTKDVHTQRNRLIKTWKEYNGY